MFQSMKTRLFIAAVISIATVGVSAVVSATEQEQPVSPAASKRFKVVLASPITKKALNFTARTVSEFRLNKELVPAGSVLQGRVDATLPVVSPSGSLRLVFDSLQTESGMIKLHSANLVTNAGVVRIERGERKIRLCAKVFRISFPDGMGCTGMPCITRSASGTGPGVFVIISRYGKKVDLQIGDKLEIEALADP